jgi:hypothetical protein
MADKVACLCNGKVVLVEEGREPSELATEHAKPPARVVGVTRGRVSGELCYVVSSGAVSDVFAHKPGTRDEQRLFHNVDVQIGEIDFSFATEAFTCTVEGKGGTSSIGVLADDGKGVRSVTEGDVLDRAPRWAPGGSAEIVYASAGIGRTRSGARAGRAPFSLQRLNLNEGTVEVLASDAKYDYLAPVPADGSRLYAIRRAYAASKSETSIFGAASDALRAPFRLLFAPKAATAERMWVWGNLVEVAHGTAADAHAGGRDASGYELVCITPKSTVVLARGVLAFDLAANGDIVYSNGRALFRAAADQCASQKKLANLERIEQIVIV